MSDDLITYSKNFKSKFIVELDSDSIITPGSMLQNIWRWGYQAFIHPEELTSTLLPSYYDVPAPPKQFIKNGIIKKDDLKFIGDLSNFIITPGTCCINGHYYKIYPNESIVEIFPDNTDQMILSVNPDVRYMPTVCMYARHGILAVPFKFFTLDDGNNFNQGNKFKIEIVDEKDYRITINTTTPLKEESNITLKEYVDFGNNWKAYFLPYFPIISLEYEELEYLTIVDRFYGIIYIYETPDNFEIPVISYKAAPAVVYTPTNILFEHTKLDNISIEQGQFGVIDPFNIVDKFISPKPFANAGTNLTVKPGSLVVLDGTKSHTDFGELTYNWEQIEGPTVTLNNPDSSTPDFTAPELNNVSIVFKLVVNNGLIDSEPAYVTINVVDIKPVANAGANQSAAPGTLVMLNGSNSYDPDGTTLYYSWSQISGPPVTLSDPETDKPTFTMPSTPIPLVFQLLVSDGYQTSDPSYTVVNILNLAPVAEAGPDIYTHDLTLILDGSASFDPNGDSLMYYWEQLSGGEGALYNATSAIATFVCEEYTTTPFVFKLTVTDTGNLSASDTVTITLYNNKPVVNVNPFHTMVYGNNLQLTVNATDSDEDTLTYYWEQLIGDPINILNPESQNPILEMPPSHMLEHTQLSKSSSYIAANSMALAKNNNVLYVARAGQIIATTSNIGMTWNNTNSPALQWARIATTRNGQYILAGANNSGLYLSANYGNTWTLLNLPDLPSSHTWSSVVISDYGQYQLACIANTLYLSNDYGLTWTSISFNGISKLCMQSNVVLATTTNNEIYRSSNYGSTWTRVAYDLPEVVQDIAISENGARAVAALSGNKIYYSNNGGYNWQVSDSPTLNWKCVAINNDGNIAYALANNDTIYRSSDNLVDWEKCDITVRNTWSCIQISSNGQLVFCASAQSNDTVLFGQNLLLAYKMLYNSCYIQLRVFVFDGYEYSTANTVVQALYPSINCDINIINATHEQFPTSNILNVSIDNMEGSSETFPANPTITVPILDTNII